ncbi:Alpha/Beta hydrolase protein [Infundibulicybe gibba]|nr:Alpha/Beta hydrolase protein [Infundibulicybe gibba]
MAHYPQPTSITWPKISPRIPLPVFPPPEPLEPVPHPPTHRQAACDAPYTLTTHIFPAAYLRTTREVPVPQIPPQSLEKSERRKQLAKLGQDLTSTRGSIFTDGYPKVLWNCANRYAGKSVSGRGVTLFFAHANGFPKEIWEPVIRRLFSSSAGVLIDEVWTWESVQHGDAAVINADHLSGIFDWTDNARDILNFFIYYLPSDLSVQPTHLKRIPPQESEHRKLSGFKGRTLVAVGHSYGGCTSSLAALMYPILFSSLVLIDPVIVKPAANYDSSNASHAMRLVLGALSRRSAWDSKREALALFQESPFFGAWDPEVLRTYLECGLYPVKDENGREIIRLKMPGIQEAIVFAETHTELEVWQQLGGLEERIELRWIVPGRAGANEIGGPGATQERVWLRPKNSSNVRIPTAGHLIPQEAPRELAEELENFLLTRYSPRKACL